MKSHKTFMFWDWSYPVFYFRVLGYGLWFSTHKRWGGMSIHQPPGHSRLIRAFHVAGMCIRVLTP